MSSATPEVAAAAVNECPLPRARTVSPAAAAFVTAAQISASVRGRLHRAGVAVAVPPSCAIRAGQQKAGSSLPDSIQIFAALVYCASMPVDQGRRLAGRSARPFPDAARERYDQATADLDPPLALVDLGAFDRNAADMTRRAALAGNGGRPVRVATKSLRCRFLIERALATPGYRGVMCYSLAEALWLHATGTSDDLLVAYPSVDRGALRELRRTARPDSTSRS